MMMRLLLNVSIDSVMHNSHQCFIKLYVSCPIINDKRRL